MEAKSRTRKHVGHVFIDSMRQRPEAICQIDAATGETQTNGTVLERSIKLAKCFRKFGLQPGDVLSLGGRNHLDICIPFYAALVNGMPISGVDPYFKYDEIKSLLSITRPKIAFCQQESYDYYSRALQDIGLQTKVITFDGQDNNLNQFIEAYHDDSTDEFGPSDFDTSKTNVFLISTSGTTGGLKVAAFTHDVVMEKLDLLKQIMIPNTSGTIKTTLSLSPVQWVSAYLNALLSPMLHQILLQTSRPDDPDHIIEMINKYKPAYCVVSPTLMTTLINRKDNVELSCFDLISVTGSKVYTDTLLQFRGLLRKDAYAVEPYGVTETLGLVTIPIPGTPLGSCGVVILENVKLVDPETEKEIREPKVTGELYIKDPGFTEYYNDPDATAAVFTEDGFYKTGDLLYRDENDFYFFVDRIKTLIKHRGTHVLPAEVEEVILIHPSVLSACVIGVPHREYGQRTVACVVVKPGCQVTEQEIKDVVASKLSKNKQLNGGVVFFEEMPMTSSGKIARGKVRDVIYKTLGV